MQKYFKRIMASIGLVVFMACTQVQIVHSQIGSTAGTNQPENAKLTSLKQALIENPNFLQYTEYEMLKRKQGGTSTGYSDDYGLKPYGTSPLAKEYSNGTISSSGETAYDGIDIITGARAIDESVQLDSIGVDRNPAQESNYRMLVSVLELYFNDHNTYPNSLQELIPQYTTTLPDGFIYAKTGTNYSLTYGRSSAAGTLTIGSITPLQLRSHDWQSMTKQTPSIPKILSLVPADDAVLYFRDMGKFKELEQTIQTASDPLRSIYSLGNAGKAKQKIFAQLGLKENADMQKFVTEAAFVAYDFDLYPNTDYAIIFKLKSSLLNEFVSSFVTAPKNNQGSVGDYYVIATNPDTLKTIQNTYNGKNGLATQPEAAYALSVLEKDFDGFAYLSEGLINKLTSPSYRINARRRNTILKALETLQYTTFAYRDITGSWPKSIQQIINEGYIDGSKLSDINSFTISNDGIVQHKTWGSIYNPTPIDRVSISTITPAEKTTYESFRSGYEQYWHEYIDPVGVSILVGDQIKFHTIILPLIDKSEYNWIKDIAGGEPIAFDFFRNPDRIPSLQGTMKLNVDDAIYAYYKETKSYYDDDYKTCTDNFYKTQYDNINTRTPRSLEEVCKVKEKPRDEAIRFIKDKVAKAIGWQEKTPVFDFIGNEITIAAGENLVFNIEDFTNFDVYFGAELKDPVLAKKFLDEVFAWLAKEMKSGGGSSGGYGFIKFDSTKPIKNTYNGVEYYVVPLGITNVYYAFIGNRFYLTIAQSALNNIIDGKKPGAKAPAWSKDMQRLFDYIGPNMNVGFVADNTKLEPWLRGVIKDQWLSYTGQSSLKEIKSYYTESLLLAQSLPGYDGTNKNASTYYRLAPTEWFDASLSTRSGNLYIKTKTNEYNVADIDLGNNNYYYGSDSKTKKQYSVTLEDVTKEFSVDDKLATWQKIKDLGVAMSFTQEGLDIRIAFTNTASTKLDGRVGTTNSFFSKNKTLIGYGAGVGIVLILIGVGLYLRSKRSTPTEEISLDNTTPEGILPNWDAGQQSATTGTQLPDAVTPQTEKK